MARIVERWTHLFRERWEAHFHEPVTEERLNRRLAASVRVQKTEVVSSGRGDVYRLAAIYVDFERGCIYKVDELDRTAIALVARRRAA